MRSAANPVTGSAIHADDDASHQVLGLMIVSLFPALFWTAALAGAGAALGYTLNVGALASFGTAVAAFLAAVGQVLFSRA